MRARTHDMAAATALLGTVVIFQPPSLTLATAIAAFVANQLGGIAPDIDQPTAPFWRNLPIGGIVGKIIAKAMGGHRFLSHSLVGLVLLGFLSHLLLSFLQPLFPHVQSEYVWWAFMIGAVSHLVMDTFTKEGVPWLLPIPLKIGLPPIKELRVTTGKNIETLIVFPILMIIFVVLALSHYNLLLAFLHNHIAG